MTVSALALITLLGLPLAEGYCAAGRRLQTTTARCSRPLDLIYLLDDSGSIEDNDPGSFELAKRFIADTADAFDVGLDRTRLGVVKFSTFASVAVPLDYATNYCAFSNAVQNITYGGGATYTYLGVNESMRELARAGRPASQGVSRVILTITDGRSNGCYPDISCCGQGCPTEGVRRTVEAANALGITTAVITVGNITLFNPNEIAYLSGNLTRLQFNLASYRAMLGTIVSRIQALACNEPARLAPGATVSTGITVSNATNSSLFYAYYNVSGPLDIRLSGGSNATNSSLNLCISYANPNPGTAPGANDGCANRQVDGSGNVTLSITAHPNAVNNTVYVVCEGSGGDGNSTFLPFSLNGSPCGTVHVNLTTVAVTSDGGAGANATSANPYYNVSAVLGNTTSAGQPRCFSCPPDQVMLASSGPNAGLCAARCLSPREWAWPFGRRLCQPCHASCYKCAPAGGSGDCISCNDGFLLLPASLDPALSDADRAAAVAGGSLTGRCVAYDGCPPGSIILPVPGEPYAEMCAAPSPTRTGTPAPASPSASVTPPASSTGTASGSVGATATPSLSAAATESPSAAATPSASVSSSVAASASASVASSPSTSVAASPSSSVAASSSASASVSGAATPTSSASTSELPPESATPQLSSSATRTPSVGASPSDTPSAAATSTPSRSGSPSPSGTGTMTPTSSGTGSVTPPITGTPAATGSPQSTASGTASQSGSGSNSASNTATGSMTPTQSMTGSMTATMSATGSGASTGTASASGTPLPTATATVSPSNPATRTVTPGPLSANCTTPCGPQGTCRVAEGGQPRCFCAPGYTGADCTACSAGAHATRVCAAVPGCAGPCRGVRDYVDFFQCYDFLPGTSACPAYTVECDRTSGPYAYAPSPVCASCPGTVWDVAGAAGTGGDGTTIAAVPGSTCSGRGQCSASGANMCLCAAGWTGAACTNATVPLPNDPCAGVTCNGRGVCSAASGSATCACELGWYGATCGSSLESASAGGARLLTSGGGEPPASARYGWRTGPWSRCSALCGPNGTMTRAASCRAVVAVAPGATEFRLHPTVELPDDTCTSAGVPKPRNETACHRYACRTDDDGDSEGAVVVRLRFRRVFSDDGPRMQPDSPARAAFLAAVAGELQAQLTAFLAGAYATSTVGLRTAPPADLLPEDGVRVDIVGGDSIRAVLMSAAAVRALALNVSAASLLPPMPLAPRAPGSDGTGTSAVDLAEALLAALRDGGSDARSRGTWLRRADSDDDGEASEGGARRRALAAGGSGAATYVALTAASDPGYDPALNLDPLGVAGVQPSPGPAAGGGGGGGLDARSRDGAIAGGVVGGVAALVVVVAALIVQRRAAQQHANHKLVSGGGGGGRHAHETLAVQIGGAGGGGDAYAVTGSQMPLAYEANPMNVKAQVAPEDAPLDQAAAAPPPRAHARAAPLRGAPPALLVHQDSDSSLVTDYAVNPMVAEPGSAGAGGRPPVQPAGGKAAAVAGAPGAKPHALPKAGEKAFARGYAVGKLGSSVRHMGVGADGKGGRRSFGPQAAHSISSSSGSLDEAPAIAVTAALASGGGTGEAAGGAPAAAHAPALGQRQGSLTAIDVGTAAPPSEAGSA